MVEEDARFTLEAVGLSVTEVLYESSEFGQSNGVVGQDPAPGDSVSPGSAVRLRVTNPSGVAGGGREPTLGALDRMERLRR